MHKEISAINKYVKYYSNKLHIRTLVRLYFTIFIPSIILSLIMVAADNINIFPSSKFFLTKKSGINPFGALIFAPIFETFAMSFLIKLLSEKIDSQIKISFIIGLISSVIHSLQHFTSLLSAGWSFYMFSMFFIEMEKKTDYWTAFRFSCFIHFLINLTGIIILKLVSEISGA